MNHQTDSHYVSLLKAENNIMSKWVVLKFLDAGS